MKLEFFTFFGVNQDNEKVMIFKVKILSPKRLRVDKTVEDIFGFSFT